MQPTPLLPTRVAEGPWASLAHVDYPGDGLVVTRFSGRPDHLVDVQAEAPPMACIAVFLEGAASMSLDGGPLLEIVGGEAVVQRADAPVAGRFRMQAGQSIRLVDLRFTPAALLTAGGQSLVALRGDFIQDGSVHQGGPLLAGFRASAPLLRAAGDILDCRYAQPEVRQLYLRAKAMEVLALVLQTVQDASLLPRDQRERRLVMEARRLIDARYAEDWTLSRIAREVGLGEKKLKAAFRLHAGRTVHAYMRTVRIEAAASMLAAGMSVTDASLSVGYASLSHFSKSFREAIGVSPKAWRERGPSAPGKMPVNCANPSTE